MSLHIYYEDDQGNVVDESGNEPIGMEIDNDLFPLDSVTSYDEYLDLKPPEKALSIKLEVTKPESPSDATKGRGYYKKHNDTTKEQFFFLVYEKGLTAGKAATQLGIARRTAYDWLNKDQKEASNQDPPIQKGVRGRKPILNEEHKEYLTEKFKDFPSATVDQALESLTTQFMGLKVSKSTVHSFMTENCALSFKRAHFESKERNSLDNIQNRYDWVVHWSKTDLDYESNCIFIDESAFHINMKRNMAWSEKGKKAVVVQPQTRAKTTTILGAISPRSIINIRVRRPLAPSKKRKLGGTKAEKSVGTVTGHYFNFIASTLDILDQHEEFKGNYIIMDNAPIHMADSTQKLIVSRGYGCVYLPPYSPELNPIEQFWSVVKSKLKREKLLQNETLTSRIADACNKILISDLKGFCRYSAKMFEVCLNKEPL